MPSPQLTAPTPATSSCASLVNGPTTPAGRLVLVLASVALAVLLQALVVGAAVVVLGPALDPPMPCGCSIEQVPGPPT